MKIYIDKYGVQPQLEEWSDRRRPRYCRNDYFVFIRPTIELLERADEDHIGGTAGINKRTISAPLPFGKGFLEFGDF